MYHPFFIITKKRIYGKGKILCVQQRKTLDNLTNPEVVQGLLCKPRKEKSHPFWDDFFFSGCGGRTRTYDLRVMSPTSFQLLYSAIWALL